MAHDGFLGSFHGLAWPFDALQLQQVVAGGGWEHGALEAPLASLAAAAAGEASREAALVMDELASRLGGVCSDLAGVVPSPSPSPPRYASCYSTPASSLSKPAQAAVPVLAADAVLAERAAARASCLPSAGGLGGSGKLSRVSSSQSLLPEPAPSPAAAADPGGAHFHGSDGSSSDGHCRKRKLSSAAKAKGKDAATTAITKSPEQETRSKKCKLSIAGAGIDDPINPAKGDGKGKEPAGEPLKDYIHVRARRGQATDSHSLAERVRREKISERMKLLQDLVPGCSKVTGKAVMLDEIINYVQSLQRQVEFLSMKLATVNPRLDFDVDSLIPKDVVPPQANPPAAAPPPTSLPLPPPAASFCYASPHSQGTAMLSAVTSTEGLDMPRSFANHGVVPCSASIDGFQSAISEVVSLWEDDLQSVVQMGFRGNT